MAFHHNFTTKHHVWETISIEFEGPFVKTSSGNQYIVVLTDLFSKWVEAKALAEKAPTDVATFILSTFSRMGFCDCKFLNLGGDFERQIRLKIHKLGSPFVQNVEKFKEVLDRVLENMSEANNRLSEVRQFGYHTETITSYIGENPKNWDANLEEFLFKLRMGDGSDAQTVSSSPFSIVYGRNSSENNSASNGTPEVAVKRGRGRPPRKSKLTKNNANYYDEDSDFVPPSCNQNRQKSSNAQTLNEVQNANDDGTTNEETICKKRGRGRPKKIKGAEKEETIEPDNKISLDKKYKLRTRLKATFKTNIVTHMLKRSTQKRSLPFDVGPNTIFVSVDEKFKQKNKSSGSDEPKYFLSSSVGDGDAANQVQLGEASIIDEAGEVTVVKLNYIPSMVNEMEEQSAPTLSIQETDDPDEGNDLGDYELDTEEAAIDNLEEEDDIELEDEDENDGDVDLEIDGEVRIQCSNCPGLYLNEKESLLHAQFHRDGSKLLHCLYCTDVTGTWENMQNHLIAHIDNNNAPGAATMLKKLRGSRAAALTSRKLRRKELAGSAAIKCSLCPTVRMASRVEEEVHQNCHREGSQLLRCPYCDHVSGNWRQMQAHLAEHPEVPLESYAVPIEERTCLKCEKVFPTSEMVVEHQYLFHVDSNKFQCELCGKVFKERKSMARHKELHADITHKCEVCNYKTKIRQDLDDHKKIHQGFGFKCNSCEKIFARQSQLHSHQEVHNKDQTLAICHQCGYEAHGMAALRYHNRDVHGECQTFKCTLCDYIGKTKSNLKGHTDRIHNKQFKCTVCSFETLAECTLARHMDIYHNEEERKHPCQHCPYRARDVKCLTEHMRVLHNPHMQKIPCEFCKMEFKTKSMLRDHLPQHTGQRFICKLCNYVAKYRSILYRHVKKKHPGHTLASVTKSTEPVITHTPEGKPILMTRTRGPSRRSLQSADDIARHLCPIMSSAVSVSDDILEMNDSESQTTTLTIVASENDEMLDPTSELMKDRGNGIGVSGDMYIMDDGETLTVNENSIVLDANLLVQAAAGGGSIAIDDNMCLHIIRSEEEGDDVTMQVIRSVPNDGGDSDKPMELLLFNC